jgi:hypothetical protein
MLCEMEDTLAEGFKGHRQLPYAQWICFLIRCACDYNTPGVDHQLSSGFKLKHDKLVEMTMPKSNLWK